MHLSEKQNNGLFLVQLESKFGTTESFNTVFNDGLRYRDKKVFVMLVCWIFKQRKGCA